MVDGVLASCYGSFHHDMAYVAMSPIQWYPELIGWIFSEENGSPGYVEMARSLGTLMLPYNLLFKY